MFKEVFNGSDNIITEGQNKKITEIAEDGIQVLKDLLADADPKLKKRYSIRIQEFQKAIKTQKFTFDQVQWLIDSDII
jgi:hypothetical protein